MLKLSTPHLSEDAIAAAADVLRSGQLVHGEDSNAFEAELAAYLGCEDVVLVSSGTAALHVALLALDIGPGDAVIIPDFSFPATGSSVAMTGATPVIVDVDPGNYTLNTVALEKAIQQWEGPQRLRAIMPVHEFGQPADMGAIMTLTQQHELAVVEDAACALGASCDGKKLGTFGDAGCFSFHPRKTLTTGEGGAIAVSDPALAQRMRRLRSHGMERSSTGVEFLEPATNYRLTNFQAALGRQQLPDLDAWIARRRELVEQYRQLLEPLAQRGWLRLPTSHAEHSWQTFMVVLHAQLERGAVIAGLREQGIESNLGAQSLSTLGLFGTERGMTVGPELYRSGLALPLFEQMSEADVERVSEALSELLTVAMTEEAHA